MKVWFLEGLRGPRKTLQRVRLNSWPFAIGRDPMAELTLDSPGISRLHAQFEPRGDDLVLRDLGSTNGTYLNRERLSEPAVVESGDIVHFANEEFRAMVDERSTRTDLKMTMQGVTDLPADLPGGAARFHDMLLDGLMTAAFQPIITTGDRSVHAYEMLGRGIHPELPESPAELFRIAESLEREIELSELMRQAGTDLANEFDATGRFFTNIHPSELDDPDRLIGGLATIRQRHPSLRLILEIHEASITDRDRLAQLSAQLRELDIGIAYDDFGVGQSRLMELADVPPDYVKLDAELIEHPQLASEARHKLVKMITDYAAERGIKTIAEGVRGEDEVTYSASLKFDFMQGYALGHPMIPKLGTT
ncbi:MAG: EAL domain-containing protein [Pseudomonadota bacterium]